MGSHRLAAAISMMYPKLCRALSKAMSPAQVKPTQACARAQTYAHTTCFLRTLVCAAEQLHSQARAQAASPGATGGCCAHNKYSSSYAGCAGNLMSAPRAHQTWWCIVQQHSCAMHRACLGTGADSFRAVHVHVQGQVSSMLPCNVFPCQTQCWSIHVGLYWSSGGWGVQLVGYRVPERQAGCRLEGARIGALTQAL